MTDFKSEEVEHELISTSLDVEQLDTTLFRSKSLWIPREARGVFGGQVISQALVSATKSVNPSFALHSLHCYFLLGASPSKPIIYLVETPRHGRTYTTRSVKASQSGRLVFVMICSFQKPEPGQLSHQLPFPTDIPLPDTIVPEEIRFETFLRDNKLDPLARVYYENAARDRRTSPIDIRLAAERKNEDGAYVIMWWMRVRNGKNAPDEYEQSFQKCILAYISDIRFISTPARALGLTRKKGPKHQTMGRSLDHTIFYYSNDIDCSKWLLIVMTSPISGNGRGVAFARIYAQSGALIAITTQEGVVRIDPNYEKQKQEEVDKAKL